MFLYSLLCESYGFTFWRQWKHNLKHIKNLYRKVQKTKHSTSKSKQKKRARTQKIKDFHREYISTVKNYFDTIEKSRSLFKNPSLSTIALLSEIDYFLKYGCILIEQINRRVINDEVIPHNEKIFSLFEPHTEWISKGKAGVPQELGLRVSIVEDQYGFILHHGVMEKQTDSEVAVPLIRETKARFPQIKSCSFDKAYWTPEVFRVLSEELDVVALPKRGRCNKQEAERESSSEFTAALEGHSAVESGIHALENHGLDRCLDHGLHGFKRYISLAIVARNLQKLGDILQEREFKRQQRLEKIQETWRRKKIKLAS